MEDELRLHHLPGCAPEPSLDELAWSHMKRTGTAEKPLRSGDELQPRIDGDLRAIERNARLVRSCVTPLHAAFSADD